MAKISDIEKVFDISGIEKSLRRNEQQNTQNTQENESTASMGPAGAPVSSSSGTARAAIMKSGGMGNPEIDQLQDDLRKKPDGESQYQNPPKPLLH